MLTFSWFGQACFKIEKSCVLLTDPHDGDSVGLEPPEENVADLVTISHDHHDHSSGKELVSQKNTKIFDDSGDYVEGPVSITGITSYHDKAEGEKRGENIIYVIEMEGTRICHLGDLGHGLSESYLEKMGSVDVLLVPVGGNYTIDGKEAAEITEELNPQVVVPMHYKAGSLTVDVAGPDQFLEEISSTYEVCERESLDLESLYENKQRAVVLDCLGC